MGNWADGNIAVSCTGIGEAFIYAGGTGLDDACNAMLAEVAHQRGDGGVIAVNRSDAMPLACNSAGMKRAVAGAGHPPFIGIG
ncbi:isoaspartyl peptidase/L-asparaginase [Erythrobacter ramosus]|uniref:isoaspartyl peptidase/L-asparaginase n=1 Tax=Erythrobacter ramosus TaxID=35811 RepID=UPI003145204A